MNDAWKLIKGNANANGMPEIGGFRGVEDTSGTKPFALNRFSSIHYPVSPHFQGHINYDPHMGSMSPAQQEQVHNNIGNQIGYGRIIGRAPHPDAGPTMGFEQGYKPNLSTMQRLQSYFANTNAQVPVQNAFQPLPENDPNSLMVRPEFDPVIQQTQQQGYPVNTGEPMLDAWSQLLKESKRDPRLARAGVSGYNKPKRTPNHPKKSHIVVARSGGKTKTIRFGEQGASVAGKPKAGESKRMKNKRKSFKSRHAKNIARGPMSAAYWANKVKW